MRRSSAAALLCLLLAAMPARAERPAVALTIPGAGVVTVQLEADGAHMGDVLALEGDNDNDTPRCGVGRAARSCVVTAPAQIVVWLDDVGAPTCSRPVQVRATVVGVEVARWAASGPAACAWLPGVGR